MPDGSSFDKLPERRGGRRSDGAGTPAFIPTQDQQHMVMVMRANGDSLPVIARAVRVSVSTLKRHFPLEIKNGFEDVKSRVQAAVVRSALSGNVAAQKFWLCRYVPEWRIARDSNRDNDTPDMPPAEAVNFYMPPNGRDVAEIDDQPPMIEGEIDC